MGEFILRRLLAAIPVLLIVTLIAASIMQLVPGDPAAVIAGQGASDAEVAQVRAQLGLDRSFPVRLAEWYVGLARGDLGHSLMLNRSVGQAILERVPVTLALSGVALLLTVLIGVPAGVLAALRPNSWVDQLVLTLALVGVSVPNFWLSLMLIVLFGVIVEWFPTGGYVPFADDPVQWARSLVLPSISLALLQIGLLARITRATMLEVLRNDYVRTARAKGLPRRMVVGKHALKNVMIPVVTVIGISFGLLLSGSVVIETVYSIPGMGRLLATAIFSRDYPVIQGGLLVTAATLVLLNLVVDLLYAALDPRVTYDRR
ncbi:peptide/nickel transport system permease protein [Stella humosa]|uniref:Peptide/nickel transport system permease protein n=1 Tax=Stella humosa TaxID=94 RepID=A0A3N1KQD4_9PROT|nr:ABC transporter permease [Stella humosa]ROP84013.1 peptide/nickel transport system permease protein [Stella humosa]BBK33522.1 ABC di/oligopeptide transporter inner membrane subunit [Stella humosa]